MSFIDQLVGSLDVRLAQLRAEIDVLTRARDQLRADGDGRAAPASRSTRQPAPRRAHKSTTRSSTEVAPADKLLRLLAGNNGLSTVELSKQANADPAQVLPLLREMEASGAVRRTGQRRGTRWHAVSGEEEWIARRAAELAARSRSA